MLTPLCLLISLAKAAPHVARATCTIPAHGNGTDDTPAILAAFEECGHGGHIIFNPDTTYVSVKGRRHRLVETCLLHLTPARAVATVPRGVHI